jgi:hypothetical protein
MVTDRQDLLDAFIALMRDAYPATVSFKPDSAELAAVLEALRRAAGEPASLRPPSAPGTTAGTFPTKGTSGARVPFAGCATIERNSSS